MNRVIPVAIAAFVLLSLVIGVLGGFDWSDIPLIILVGIICILAIRQSKS